MIGLFQAAHHAARLRQPSRFAARASRLTGVEDIGFELSRRSLDA